jgi:hypothetical protein
MIKLGQKCKDRISGLEGVSIGRCEYLYGCVQVLVKPQELHEGQPVKGHWIDEPQLEGLEQVLPEPVEAKHGPQGEAPRAK